MHVRQLGKGLGFLARQGILERLGHFPRPRSPSLGTFVAVTCPELHLRTIVAVIVMYSLSRVMQLGWQFEHAWPDYSSHGENLNSQNRQKAFLQSPTRRHFDPTRRCAPGKTVSASWLPQTWDSWVRKRKNKVLLYGLLFKA